MRFYTDSTRVIDMVRLVVAYVRHGKRDTDGFNDGSAGTRPSFLTEAGVQQVVGAGNELRKIDDVSHFIATPLPRTLQTATIMQAQYLDRGFVPIKIEPALIERQVAKELNNGLIPYGMKWVDFRTQQAVSGYPDIEHFSNIKERVQGFVDRISETATASGLIVAAVHQDVVHAAVAGASNTDELDPRFNPGVNEASFTVIVYEKPVSGMLRAHVEVYNETQLSRHEVEAISGLLRN